MKIELKTIAANIYIAVMVPAVLFLLLVAVIIATSLLGYVLTDVNILKQFVQPFLRGLLGL